MMSSAEPQRIQDHWTLNGQRLQQLCWERGWDWGELARRAGISRGTLYQWQKQKTAKPRLATLHKLAEVLGVESRQLMFCTGDSERFVDTEVEPPSGAEEASPPPWEQEETDWSEPVPASSACLFDRQTNWSVQETCEHHPNLFEGWQDAEWDELYSSFGTGGELNEAGVMKQAEQINQKRETMYQLQVILETHLADAAERIIRSLYDSVQISESGASGAHQLNDKPG